MTTTEDQHGIRLSGWLWTAASTVSAGGIHVLKLAVLARLLTADELGHLAIINVVITLALLLSDGGISNYTIHRQNAPQTEQSTLFWLSLGLGVGVAVIVALSSPVIARWYRAPELIPLISLSVLMFPVFSAGAQFQAQLTKRFRFIAVAKVDIASRLTSLAATAWLAWTGFGVISFVAGQIIGTLLKTVCLYVYCKGDWRPDFTWQLSGVGRAVRFSGLTSVGQLLNRIVADLDVVLIGRFFDIGTVGRYSLAKELAFGVLRVLATVVARVGLPLLASKQRLEHSLAREFLKLMSLTSIGSTILVSTIIVVSPWLVTTLYGDGYSNIIPLFAMFGQIVLIRAFGTVHGLLILATGRPELDLYWNVFVMVVTSVAICLAVTHSVELVLWAMLFTQILLYLAAYGLLIGKMVQVSLYRYCLPLVPAFLAILLLGIGGHWLVPTAAVTLAK